MIDRVVPYNFLKKTATVRRYGLLSPSQRMLLWRSKFKLSGIIRRVYRADIPVRWRMLNSYDANISSQRIPCLHDVCFNVCFCFLRCRCGNSRDCFCKTGSCCRGSFKHRYSDTDTQTDTDTDKNCFWRRQTAIIRTAKQQ